MKRLMDWIVRLLRGDCLLRLADQIATRCHPSIWQCVGARLSTMTPAEARGYVRVRSHQLVQREINRALHQTAPLSDVQRDRLVQLTIERVLAIAADQLASGAAREKRLRRVA